MNKILLKNIIICICFGLIYMNIEIIWRGRTSISMGIIGGLCGCIIGQINEYYPKGTPCWLQCAIGTVVITFFEGISGLILNGLLKLNVWDYSNMPGRFFFGQCCLPYCIAWFFLSGVAIILDDWLRYTLFDEPFKQYNFGLFYKDCG